MKLRIDKAKNVSVAERNLVAKWVKKCLKELAKKDYEIADGYDGGVISLTPRWPSRSSTPT